MTIFEREDGPGGLGAGVKIGPSWLEKFYHHIFQSDRRMISLIEEAGLGADLIWGRRPTALLRAGRFAASTGQLRCCGSRRSRCRLGCGSGSAWRC